jgi:hypothetical protein
MIIRSGLCTIFVGVGWARRLGSGAGAQSHIPDTGSSKNSVHARALAFNGI